MWFFIKNNPDKLFLEYEYTSDINKKNKIINRLIELDAEIILLQIFFEQESEEILAYLFENYNDNPNKLLWLLEICNNEEKVINKFLELDKVKKN